MDRNSREGSWGRSEEIEASEFERVWDQARKLVKVDFTTHYNSSGEFVKLLVAGRPKFLLGGEIVIRSRSKAFSLHGNSVFAIPEKA